jgi:hypothetical protein
MIPCMIATTPGAGFSATCLRFSPFYLCLGFAPEPLILLCVKSWSFFLTLFNPNLQI